MKKWLVMLLLVLSATKVHAKEVYIPLGDSLAAGQTPFRQIDSGYTDLIAKQLSQEIAFYTKELTFPGYTVANVLQRIEQPDAQQLLPQATIITISAGANDLLQIVQHQPDAGTLTYHQLAVDFTLNQVRLNMQQLLQKVKELAPQAEIYVMGYYFPYVTVHETQKAGTVQQLRMLNAILQQQAEEHGAHYIPVEENFDAYLPNYRDVHPTFEGYLVMANAFLSQYHGQLLTKEDLPSPQPISFEELMNLAESSIQEDLRESPY